MKLLSLLITSISLAIVSVSASADDLASLDNKAKAEQQTENAHNQQRVALSAKQRAALQAKRDQLAKQLAQIEQENAQLSDTFSANEEILAEKEKELQLATGSLGELFGVVRQAAKDVQLSYEGSLLGEQGKAFNATLDKVISTDTLPSLKLLNGLWQAMQYKVMTGSEVASVTLPFVQGDGKKEQVNALRIGDMALLTEQGYVKWDFARQQASNYLALPSDAPTLASFQQDANQAMLIDPTRGVMLEQYAHKPTLMQRIDQAGVVGKVIIAILVIGLIIALVRGVRLMMTQQQIFKAAKTARKPN